MSVHYGIGPRGVLVYIVTRDINYGEALTQQIGHFGYRVHLIESLHNLVNVIAKHQSIVVLVDVDMMEEDLFSPQGIADLRRLQSYSIPLMFISSKDDQITRLQTIRSGGKAFFSKPIEIANLIDQLDEFDSSPRSETDRVLIIESQHTIGNYYQMVLKRAGITSLVVSDASDVLKKITEYNPDLILLDLQTPKFGGIELTKMIRQVNNYVGIPIVFISNVDDLNKQTEAMSLGGDDFIIKPVKGDQLVSVIKNRLARSLVLRKFMIHDSLTGLLNHTTYRDYLKQEILRCQRQNTSLALAMIDLDHFKKVNDSYGHSVGDSVLKSLSRLLKQSLRRSDIVGRHGGEEFVAILLDTDIAMAFDVIDSIRYHFSQILHFAPNAGEFCVTFSCGIAAYPKFDNVSLLCDAADKALYAAKVAGRNRVVLSE
jgi:diguanylate cyclase (GGDEF)-like protein